LTTTSATAGPEYLEHLADLAQLEVIVDDGFHSDVRGWARVHRLIAHPASVAADDVVVLDGDLEVPALLVHLLRRRHGPTLRVLVMRAYAAPGAAGRIRHWIKSSTGQALASLGGRVYVLVDHQGTAGRLAGVTLVRDPGAATDRRSDRASARRRAALGPGRHVGLFGGVDARKCPEIAVAAVALAARIEPTTLVVAGRLEPAAAAMLDEARRRGLATRILDDYVPGAVLDDLIAACDAVLLLHRNEGPSGIQKRAQALGTPCVAAGARSLTDQVWRSGAGVVSELDPAAVAAALERAYAHRVPAARDCGAAEFGQRLLDLCESATGHGGRR
jgi:glycosyltransferase involved in cell wall biosynthesis